MDPQIKSQLEALLARLRGAADTLAVVNVGGLLVEVQMMIQALASRLPTQEKEE